MKRLNYDRITTTIECEWLAQIIAGTRHAWQGGHKAFQHLGNAPAAPNPSGQPKRRRIGFLRDTGTQLVQPLIVFFST